MSFLTSLNLLRKEEFALGKRFFICEHCGNIIAMIRDNGVAIQCCGEKMKEILSGTNNGAGEKHIPVYDVKDGKVTVTIGVVEHPMVPEHYIEWVCLETEDGIQYKQLKPNIAPNVSFFISEKDKVKAVYAFCNMHSLWKA